MIEQRLRKLENDMKALKATAPISGSLVKTFIYKKTASKVYADGYDYTCTIKFIPSDINATGIVELSYYCENWTNSATFSQYNPVGAYINSGYTINSNGEYVISTTGAFSASDGSTYEVKTTATAYGTIAGSIEIEFS